MSIKDSIYRYYAKRQKREQAAFVPYRDIRRVLVIYTSDFQEKNTEVRQLIARLQNDGKDVVAWGYCPKKDIISLVLPIGRILGLRDFDWFGRPKKHVLSDISKEEADLLLDLTQDDSLATRYLTLYAPARLKAGRRCDTRPLDFMVDMPTEETPVALFEQLTHYMKSINASV